MPQPPPRDAAPVPIRRGAVMVALAAALGLAGPAAAQQAPTPPAQQQQGPSGDGGDPVEIVADSLTVEQEKSLATFTGNVDAVQGDMRLRADRLLVFYEQEEEGGGGRAAATDQQGIRRIEAAGNVFVTQPGETAKGDNGTYEPASGAITLEGNVVLTRERNVIRGARLESNQRTGVSTVFAAAPGVARKPDQRVRALFAPAERARPAPAGPAAAGGGRAAGGGAAPAKAAPAKAATP